MLVAKVSRSLVIVLGFSVSSLIAPADATIFLGRQNEGQFVDALSRAAKSELLREMESLVGGEHRSFTERRLTKIEEVLRPIYNAVPKNEHGLLGQSAVNYILHRVFVIRHGWFVRGLDPEDNGNSFNSSSASSVSIFEDSVSSHVQALFEQRIGGKGCTLHEVAVLAATIEHLVHKEAMTRLEAVYRSQNFSSEDAVSEEEAHDVFDSYMAIYILGFINANSSGLSPSQVRRVRKHVPDVYPQWRETQDFVREIMAAIAPKRDYFYFADIANVVEEVGERYGKWQDKDCHALKDELVAMEDKNQGGAGRVRLADFYKKAVHEEKWQFGESIAYLRQLGALDESDPQNLKVMIANYVNGPSNCVASSKYYSVCCRNECEDLLGQLEIQIAKPEGSAKEIAALVADLPSHTVPGKRSLPDWLLKRLDEVAAHHGGLVPLHGRLFMQWMHFAYPRECAYPHASGTTSYFRMEDIIEEEDPRKFLAEQSEMLHHIEKPVPNETLHADAMWTHDEELVVWQPEQMQPPAYRSFVFMSSLVAVFLILGRIAPPAKCGEVVRTSSHSEKHYV